MQGSGYSNKLVVLKKNEFWSCAPKITACHERQLFPRRNSFFTKMVEERFSETC